MIEVPLSKGKVALVDDEDGPAVLARRWYAQQALHTWYAGGHEPGTGRKVLMHRFLLPTPGDVDHVNGDGLDNRRTNLRAATHQQNMRNMRGGRAKSGFKGVNKHGRRWEARIWIRNKSLIIGYYPTAEEAARAYDRVSRHLFGEYARPNFTEAA